MKQPIVPPIGDLFEFPPNNQSIGDPSSRKSNVMIDDLFECSDDQDRLLGSQASVGQSQSDHIVYIGSQPI